MSRHPEPRHSAPPGDSFPAEPSQLDQVGHPRRWAILAVLLVSLLVVVLDNTILNVALKTIQEALDATQEQLIWAINSYILVFASLLFTWGVLGDRYGRKKIIMIGFTLFALASALCAFATTPDMLIAYRALMGIGAAAVLPVTLAIITVVFPPHERGRAIGMWAAAVGIAIAIGPVVGGFLLEHFWWGSVFLINVPIVAAGLVAIAILVPESRNEHPTRLDPVGVLMSIVGLTALVYGIVHGGDTQEWLSPDVLGWIVLGVAVIALWIWYEQRTDHPSLDVSLLRNRPFGVSLAAVSLAFFSLSGAAFFLSFYLQLVREYSPLEAGLCLLPLAVGQLLGAPRSGKMVERFGARAVLTTGLTIVTLVFVALAFVQADTVLWIVLVAMFFLGFGLGNTIAPATTQMTFALPPSRAGAGSAVQNTVRQVFGALGVAVLGSVLAAAYANQVSPSLAGLPDQAIDTASDSLGATLGVTGALTANGAIPADAAASINAGAVDAFVSAMHVTSWLAAASTLLAAVIVVAQLPSGTMPGMRQEAGRGEVPPPVPESAPEAAV